ncbi:hypothetical protein HH303_15755 [Rhodospirillaceae bacterium KN72]|uniref:Uncharacterized protein n=1 Tax=Pacificispira spongiicola TaxID=2729598 RepID=A0A7Y0HGR9_9PROT|nr:hypothetical protein [Pacificispira spongiicola]NMM45953.1 hypothetical protein [Pacificispira spongiicola]
MIGTRNKKSPATNDEIATLEAALHEANGKVDQVRARRDNLNAERRKLEERRWALDLEALNELDTAALGVLDDPNYVIDTADLDARLRQIAAEQIVIERAASLARKRRSEAAKRYSNAIAKTLIPAHRAAVSKIADALKALDAANQEEAEIRAKVPGGGALLPVSAFLPAGSLAHELSPISCWMRYASAAGLLRED